MNKIKTSYNPHAHITMLARVALEIVGDYDSAQRVLIDMSRCTKEHIFKKYLGDMSVFPGTPGHMSIGEYNDLFSYFQENRDAMAMVDIIIEECLEKEYFLYINRRDFDDEDEPVKQIRFDW